MITDGKIERSWGALLAIAGVLVSNQLQAASLKVSGTAGYLSEWEFHGEVAPTSTNGEFSGPVTWEHVGLCSANGPERKSGKITLRLTRSGQLSEIRAALSLDRAECTFSAAFSDQATGMMDCSDAKGVPLALSLK